MRRRPALREILQAYLAFYRANWAEGKLSACDEPEVKSQARRLLAAEPGFAEASGSRFDVYAVAGSCLEMQQQSGGSVFRKLSKAFEFLELLCVNLFLSPWRKEIKSLKTFTGNFVYYVQSILPEGVVDKLLKEIGYVATTATEFSLVRKLNEEEAEQAAFELFLARIECENLLEIAESVRDSDLMDILQKKAQQHWQPEGNLHRKHWPSQSKEDIITGGTRQAQGYLGPWQTNTACSKLAIREVQNAELGDEHQVTLTAEEPQSAASQFTSKQNASQSQASANSCFRGSDSGDFLTKYSDIAIGQKRVHFSELAPTTPEHGIQSRGLSGSAWPPPENDPQSPALFPPDPSGPQALTILNDVCLESKVPYGYRSPESSRKTAESKICDAISCLSVHNSEPTDEPKELKWDSIQCTSKHAAHGISGKEAIRDSSIAFKEMTTKEDGGEKLMYPIEEMGQLESPTSKRGIQDFDHSRMKLVDQSGSDRNGFSVDFYSSEQFCNINRCDPNYSRLPGDLWGPHEFGEYFRNSGQMPIPVSTEAQYHNSAQTNIQCRGKGCPLHSSFPDFDTSIVSVSETNPEG